MVALGIVASRNGHSRNGRIRNGRSRIGRSRIGTSTRPIYDPQHPFPQAQQNDVARHFLLLSWLQTTYWIFKNIFRKLFSDSSGHILNFCLAPSEVKNTHLESSDRFCCGRSHFLNFWRMMKSSFTWRGLVSGSGGGGWGLYLGLSWLGKIYS
jgi:hypothetical protein